MTDIKDVSAINNVDGNEIEENKQFINLVKKSSQENFDKDFSLSVNTLRYSQIFKKNRDTKLFLSWNWSAFLFESLWFAYRKMYMTSFALLFLGHSLVFLLNDSTNAFALHFFIRFCIRLLAGCFADTIYVNKIRLKMIDNNIDNSNNVSIVAVIIVLLIDIMISLLPILQGMLKHSVVVH